MLEANTFRFMMLIGAVVAMSVMLMGAFYTPLVDIDAEGKQNYENVMNVELADDVDALTGYQALRFNLQAKLRGGIDHY